MVVVEEFPPHATVVPSETSSSAWVVDGGKPSSDKPIHRVDPEVLSRVSKFQTPASIQKVRGPINDMEGLNRVVVTPYPDEDQVYFPASESESPFFFMYYYLLSS